MESYTSALAFASQARRDSKDGLVNTPSLYCCDACSAALQAADTLEKLDAVREWVETGIAKTLNEDAGGFLLGIESVSILDALDDIRAELVRS